MSCALHAALRGHRVHLFERSPSLGTRDCTSYGNAGGFARHAITPVNSPSLPRQLPSLLNSPESPLSLAPSLHLLRMVPWLLSFVYHCSMPKVEATTAALASLLHEAEEGYKPLLDLLPPDQLEQMVNRENILHIWSSQKSWEGAQFKRDLQHQHGVQMQYLSADEMLELEPKLQADRLYRGLLYPGTFGLKNPGGLVAALAEALPRLGATIHAGADVAAVEPSASGVRLRQSSPSAATDDVLFDSVVVACGAWSKQLAGTVGDSAHAALDTERGYHIMFPEATDVVSRPICFADTGFYISPMANGLRTAGTVELGGLHAPPNPQRLDMIERVTRSVLSADLPPRRREDDWLGFRPTMPDGLPVIGRSPRSERVVYAFGHHHIGWTLGGVTGRLVSQLLDDQPTDFDLTPFRIDRFNSALF
eukprot:gene5755-6947_t